jgi:hypothetical protein
VSKALGQIGATRPGVRRRLAQMRKADLCCAAARERRLTCKALVDDAPERVDVALARGFSALDQLGREVMRRPEQLALGGQPRRIGPAREPEVGEGRGALAVQEHVRRLDVPVQDPARVKSVQAAAELRGEVDHLVDGQRPEQAQPHRQRAAGVVRHGQELDAL